VNRLGERNLARARILIVEHDQDSLELLIAVVLLCGAQPLAARSVAEALALCDDITPNLVISDLALPGRNGYSFIQEFRRRAACATVPVIAVTDVELRRERAVAAGFADLVVKPIDPDVLCDVIIRHYREAT
jgi:DNA-binding response OmpR family regulator